jgi:hypothetical protein
MPLEFLMRNALPASALVLLCAGCAAPSLITRPIHSEQDLVVRLDSYADPGKAGDLRYDHPATWTEFDLRAILEGLLVQEHGGLLDSSRPTRAVFPSGSIGRLTPYMLEAFRTAKVSEWVAFYVAVPAGAGREATSGALFIAGARLHVVIANDRERIPAGLEAADPIRANPLRSLHGTKGSLTFDAPRFVLGSQAHWSGGSAPAGSELILDHGGFLESLRRPAARVEPPQSPAAPTGGPDELQRLKRRAEELEAEIGRLKQRLSELEARKP